MGNHKHTEIITTSNDIASQSGREVVQSASYLAEPPAVVKKASLSQMF